MIGTTMTFRLFLLPNFAENQSVTIMEIITFESKAYKELDNKITAIADYIFNHAEMAKQSEEDMWVDSYEVCTFLKISEKTLQRLRVSGTTNDKELSDMLIEVAKTVPGINNIRPDGNFGGSEDISVLGKRVQAHGGKAAFFICGADRAAGHHQGSFDIDEGAFKQAFDMYVGMAKKLNG